MTPAQTNGGPGTTPDRRTYATLRYSENRSNYQLGAERITSPRQGKVHDAARRALDTKGSDAHRRDRPTQ
jgi:hypothetical protein